MNTGTFDQNASTWEVSSTNETILLTMTVIITDTEEYTNVTELIYLDQLDNDAANDRAEARVEITGNDCLTVYTEFFSKDNGAKDVFFIQCIEQYPNNHLQVLNRWEIRYMK